MQINEEKTDITRLKKADFEKDIVKVSKMNFERFIELIDKAESSGYDFIKFQKELGKDGQNKEKNKSIDKKRKKV
jgi:sialic acid synthase SpsE